MQAKPFIHTGNLKVNAPKWISIVNKVKSSCSITKGHSYTPFLLQKKEREKTCDAQVGTFIQISNTLAPQAIDTDLRGSDKGGLFSSEVESA